MSNTEQAELYELISAGASQPFQELLARLLSCEPSEKALRAFARAHPDAWTKAVSQVARLAGYHEKREVDLTLIALVGKLSDVELHGRLQEAREKLTDARPAITVEADGSEANVVERTDKPWKLRPARRGRRTKQEHRGKKRGGAR